MRKKIILSGVIVEFCLFFCLINWSSQTSVIYRNYDYDFSYTVQYDGNKKVSTYVKEDNKANERTKISAKSHDFGKIKAILSSLGMSDEVIGELSNEQLIKYSTGKSITTTLTYYKYDEEENMVEVSEEEVLSSRIIDKPIIVPQPGTGDEGSIPRTATYIDDYMSILCTVVYLGDATYLFSTTAYWNFLPLDRYTDTLGICTTDITVENATRNGWVKYNECGYNSGNLMFIREHEETLSDFVNVTNGIWYGSLSLIELPTTYYEYYNNKNCIVEQLEYSAYYEYEGKVRYPDNSLNFEVYSSYDHAYSYILTDTSFEISTSGVSVGIGFSKENGHIIRNVEFPSSFSYLP